MNRTVRDRIIDLIVTHPDVRGVDRAAITDDTNLQDHLGIDDLVLVDLAFQIDDEFGVVLADSEIDFKTVGDLIATVETHLAAEKAA